MGGLPPEQGIPQGAALPQVEPQAAPPPPQGMPPAGVPPAAAPPPQQAALPPVDGGQPDVGVQGDGQGYNGAVEAFGQQVNVVDGMGEFNGEQFFISRNGDFVVDSQQMVIGRIDNGAFVEADDAYIQQLREKGMIEEGG